MSRDDRSGPDGLTRWQKIRLVVKVVELRLRFIALMTITGLVFAYWDALWNRYEKWMRPTAERYVAAAGIEYYCPMHPQVVQDEPGTCPICGMPLARRKKGEKATLPEGVTARVQLAQFQVQQAGVKTVEVGYAPLTETLTTVGYVERDERRVAHIASKVPGKSRVEKLYVNFEGTNVQPGQPLAELYSPELYQATHELLNNQRRAAEGPRPMRGGLSLGDPAELLRLSIEKLELWGITADQINKMLRQGQADYRVPIYSPLEGGSMIHVIQKNVVQGQYVDEGQPMFVVADLSHVWIRAKVYEDDLSLVRLDQEVEATVESFPGEVFRGKVAFVFPQLDPATRTVDVRYDMENLDHRLRPGMFATVRLKTPVAETPMFQNVRRGMAPPEGKTVRLANRTVAEQKVCPVTGARLGSMGDPLAVDVDGRKVWTCCATCPPKLKSQPARYLARLEPPPRDQVLSVPESAVIDTGTYKVVYVESEPGLFDGRRVVLGPRIGDRFPVLEGLAPGEKVAADGSFLIDAESRINPGSAPAQPHDGAAPTLAGAPDHSADTPAEVVHRH